MPDQRDDLSIHAEQAEERLNITLEDLQGAWVRCLEGQDDRKEGEFSLEEVIETWGIPRDTAYDRLNKMIFRGLVSKRAGRHLGKRINWYSLVK